MIFNTTGCEAVCYAATFREFLPAASIAWPDSCPGALCRVILDFVAYIRGENAGNLAEAAFTNARRLFEKQ